MASVGKRRPTRARILPMETGAVPLRIWADRSAAVSTTAARPTSVVDAIFFMVRCWKGLRGRRETAVAAHHDFKILRVKNAMRISHGYRDLRHNHISFMTLFFPRYANTPLRRRRARAGDHPRRRS